jgi:hypothetical protein
MAVSRISFPVFGLAALLIACGGATPAAESPEPEPAPEATESSPPPSPAPESTGTEDNPAPAPSASTPEPTFPENASVDDAIKAVPQGVERRNIDPETLAKPLQDLSLYESCKPGAAKVKMRIAVWDGKAVGIDLTVAPKNDKLADCIKAKLREITWEKKVKSLNTIEYNF